MVKKSVHSIFSFDENCMFVNTVVFIYSEIACCSVSNTDLLEPLIWSELTVTLQLSSCPAAGWHAAAATRTDKTVRTTYLRRVDFIIGYNITDMMPEGLQPLYGIEDVLGHISLAFEAESLGRPPVGEEECHFVGVGPEARS